MSIEETEVMQPQTAEVIPYEGGNLMLVRDPVAVLEEARSAAMALKDVISKKEKPVIFGGEQYLEFEDWQTLGAFFGITAKVVSTEFVDYGGAQGFLARAVAINSHDREVSAAEAMCLNDEDKWSSRTKYEWHYVKKSGGTSLADPGQDELVWEPHPEKPGKNRPKKVRIKVSDERVPFFQLRSMAQTRAAAKCLRNVLAWVVVMAGYKPTPAEEMTDGAGGATPVTEKAEAPLPATPVTTLNGKPLEPLPPLPATAAPPANIISEAQAKRFRAISAKREKEGAGWTVEHAKALLADHAIPSSNDIPKPHYNRLVDIVEKKTWDQYLDSKIPK
jgi:hypothetical protein